ncbi:MAG TPA: aldehyde dehydrogenase family protein [Gaiellaceae bacterium]|jgi:acyl-CoA reductase-like NAD-dependent aldehyde dehydrogenase|nr:aldehyde dehydrogenase family protein [Gaiellaceae bacterium]
MATTSTDHPLLIGGERVETGDWTEVRSPYSGEVVGRIAKGGAAEARRALDVAAAALTSPLPAHERARILDATAQLLSERQEEAAQLICAEAGKPLKAARVEAQRAVSTYTFAAVEARKLSGETVPMDASAAGAGKLAFTMRVPIGVIGAISPFNFPLNLVAHKIAPALAAGCPVVLKPASTTPLSALFLADLEEEAGLPPGWLNVVSGSAAAIGDEIVGDERVKLITFTGSSGVGWDIAARAAQKRVKLELGNATPAIVCADAPADTAAKLAANAFSFAGQSCISVQRIFVLADAWDEFIGAFVPKVEALKVGDPSDPDTDVGPVISDSDRERILEWIGETKGDVLTGGDTTEDGLIRPTVIARPAASDRVQCEEVFGPVVTVTPVASLDEAIEQANATKYGLQAAIFSNDLPTCLEAAQRLEFGGVIVNEAPTFRADQMPYGGVKASGNTKEGPAWAVREMTEERLVVLSL